MEFKSRKIACCLLAALLMSVGQTGTAQEPQTPEGAPGSDEASVAQQFGGPGSVPGQLADDRRLTESVTGVDMPEGWADWKKGLVDKHGFDFSLDYTTILDSASQTLGEEDFFAGGALRFFGTWDLVGRESGNTGSFVFKVEHRHKYTEIPPQGTASEIGYVGLMFPTISNIGTRLTNLYWKQNLNQNRVEIIGGFIDTTDWLDLYALAAPWAGFSNFAMATGGASIPTPDDATLGIYVNAMLTEKLYVIGGFADSNADSTDPGNGFDTFFNQHEFFKSIEIGMVTSQDRFYFDNTHITFWHADERREANVEGGWGAAFSYSHSFNDKWMPFVRAGYAENGGSLLQKTLSTGVGYHFSDDISLLGFGFNWGEPNEGTFGPGLENQYAMELFTRLQVMQNLQITPDIQLVINPARHPEVEQSWIFAVRARLVF